MFMALLRELCLSEALTFGAGCLFSGCGWVHTIGRICQCVLRSGRWVGAAISKGTLLCGLVFVLSVHYVTPSSKASLLF